MPMRRLLWGQRVREQRDAMDDVARARRIRDEANARSRIYPKPPLETRATPVDPPRKAA